MTSELTPFEFAETWYSVKEIREAIARSGTDDFGAWTRIPSDVRSAEFADWLTRQYRLAMAKGIQIGRQQARRGNQ